MGVKIKGRDLLSGKTGELEVENGAEALEAIKEICGENPKLMRPQGKAAYILSPDGRCRVDGPDLALIITGKYDLDDPEVAKAAAAKASRDEDAAARRSKEIQRKADIQAEQARETAREEAKAAAQAEAKVEANAKAMADKEAAAKAAELKSKSFDLPSAKSSRKVLTAAVARFNELGGSTVEIAENDTNATIYNNLNSAVELAEAGA